MPLPHPRLLAVVLSALVSCPAVMVAQTTASGNSVKTTNSHSSTAAQSSADLPDSAGTTWAMSQEPQEPQQGAAETSIQEDELPPPAKQNQTLQRPVGTAAAEAPRVSGITAAQPAGVAIAPAKQRRVRTIVFKVGAIIGAGVAIGTVVALTSATPSKPPGAH